MGWPKNSGVDQWLESSTYPCQSQGRLRPQALSFRSASRFAQEARPPRRKSWRTTVLFSVHSHRSRRRVIRRLWVDRGRRRDGVKSCSLFRSRRRLSRAMAVGQTHPLMRPSTTSSMGPRRTEVPQATAVQETHPSRRPSSTSHFGPGRTDVPQPVHPVRQRRWMYRRPRVGLGRSLDAAVECLSARPRRRIARTVTVGQMHPQKRPGSRARFDPREIDLPQPVHPIRQRR